MLRFILTLVARLQVALIKDSRFTIETYQSFEKIYTAIYHSRLLGKVQSTSELTQESAIEVLRLTLINRLSAKYAYFLRYQLLASTIDKQNLTNLLLFLILCMLCLIYFRISP